MNRIKNIFAGIIIVLIFIFVAFIAYNLVEPKAYDFMIKQVFVNKLPFDKLKKVDGNENIILAVIDSKTVEKYSWPWRRDFDTIIIKYFSEYAKPKLIIDDSIFNTMNTDSQGENRFFNTINKLDNYIAGFMPKMFPWEDSVSGKKYNDFFAQKFSIKVTDNEKQEITPYYSMIPSPYKYLDSVINLGHVYMPVGALNKNISSWAFDNITRTNEYIIKYENAYYPSVGLKSYLLINPNSEITIKNRNLLVNSTEKVKVKLLDKSYAYHYFKKYKLQTYSNPIRFYKINPYSGYSHQKYSMVDIIDSYIALKQGKKPIINPEIFNDKIVIIGANVPAGAGLNDNKNSPVAVNHPGVDIQATVVDNIINNDFLVVLPQVLNILITILGMLLVYSFIRVFDLSKSISSTIFVNLIYLLFCTVLFYFGIVINVITPIVMFVLTTILAYTHKFVLENRSKEKVKSAMGKYMSQDVMKRIVQNIDNLGLGGKKAIVTVLFSDIRGFTTMSEQMSAQEVSEILNEYFTEMEPIISKYNGVINKFIGDAVMAIFGEPIQDKNHAQNAVKCAYEMLEKVQELQKKWAKEGKPKIEIGVGINTGEVFVGNIGSINRMEYTVIGDTVNLASRLESYNKIYKTRLLISPTTYEEVKGFVDVIKISDVQIRGKANKMDIYEILRVF